MSATLRKAVGAAIGVIFLIGVPLSFLYGTQLQKALDSILHLRIDPAYSGGPIMAVFRDRAGDDTGAGNLQYPLSDAFQNGHPLDLIKYTVHRPVVDGQNGAFWQIDLLMADPGPAVAHVYIDTGGGASGSAEEATPRSELVRFDPAHPWDIFIEIDFKDARAFLENASRSIHRQLKVFAFSNGRGLAVRVPLDIPEVERVLDGRATWHYVLIGAYDEYAPGHFMRTQADASLHAGGGSVSPLEPRVFDCLVPHGVDKATLLSSYDEASGRLAMLEPVKVEANTDTAGNDDAMIAALETRAKADTAAALVAAVRDAAAKTGIDRAIALFQAGKDAEALVAFKEILVVSPDDIRSLAYQGALIARQGGATNNLSEAIRLVREGFALMDRAVDLDRTAGWPFPDPWIARGTVAISVPEDVFLKSAQGAKDFGAAADWLAAAGPAYSETRAEMLMDEGIACERAGLADEADIGFIKAASLNPKKASTLLELARRGYGE